MLLKMDFTVTESAAVDLDDARVIRALQIAPRIGFATAGSVLGLSEAGVARRFRRMQRDGIIRVIGVLNTGAIGQSRWVVRIRCRPGSAWAIADSLARREDVTWVALSAAGSELTCVLRSRTDSQRDDLLGERLPRASAVLDIQASVMLHQFIGGRGHYWAALRGVLTPEQEADLGADGSPYSETPVVSTEAVALDIDDRRLIDLLSRDGRASLADLARTTESTPGRVSRRLQHLLRSRALDIDVETAAVALGYLARANLWLRVHPARLEEAGRLLAEMPEVVFVTALSGRDNLLAVVHCRGLHELFAFASARVGGVPGVEALDVAPIVQQVKQIGTRLVDERLVVRPPAPGESTSSDAGSRPSPVGR